MIDNSQEIDSLIKKSIQQKEVMGVSYSLMSKDEISDHYIGYQGRDTDHIPLRPNMLYDLASLTKVVGTTTRTFQLLSDKTINITDNVGKFIPDLSNSQITIKQLLMHSSGLPADIKNNHNLSRDELISNIKNSTLINEPGEAVLYSDLGYIILGWLIKKIDGDLSESLQKNIFKPLDMKETMYNPNISDMKEIVPTEYQENRGGMIRGTVNDSKAFRLDGISGHAGLFSSLNDLNKFVSMYLNRGIYKGKQIIDSQFFSILNEYYQDGRTLGWKKWNPHEMYLWHTGFTGTSIALNLENHSSFVCLTNRIYPDRSKTNWLKTRRLAIGLFYNEPEVII